MENIDSCQALFLDLWDFLLWLSDYAFYSSVAWAGIGFVVGFLVFPFFGSWLAGLRERRGVSR